MSSPHLIKSFNNTSSAFKRLLIVYRLLWWCLIPLSIVYCYLKGRKEPLYRAEIPERLMYPLDLIYPPLKQRPIWIHAASMGELKAITPLIRALLNEPNYYTVLITTLTPAGKHTARQYFNAAIQEKRLQCVYLPLEVNNIVQRFIDYHNPFIALMAEIDSWPVLLTTIKRNNIRLGFINAQYPKKSFERDIKLWGFRREVFKLYDFIACKSNTHAERFKTAGQSAIYCVGETRFDLPIPKEQLSAAHAYLKPLNKRPIITIASSVASEEALFIKAIQAVNQNRLKQGLSKPLWVVVPRSPQRFDGFYNDLINSGLNCIQRSKLFNQRLQLIDFKNNPMDIDVILGDSLGEMYFYLELAHSVIVGASFVNLGSHNIIEPIALKKPVIVGFSIWGIEYPGIEALEAGILTQCLTEESLVSTLLTHCLKSDTMIDDNDDNTDHHIRAFDDFYQTHLGATEKHLTLLRPWLEL